MPGSNVSATMVVRHGCVRRRARLMVGLLLSASLLLVGCVPMIQRLSDSPPVTGQVLDARTGEPIAGVQVQVLPRDLDPGPATVSDAQGGFSLPERDRLRLFLAMAGTAVEHVLLEAVDVRAAPDTAQSDISQSDTARPGSPQRVGYATATKWMRQPAPATENRIVILMLPSQSGDAVAATSCGRAPQHIPPQHSYALHLLDLLPALLDTDWFRQRLIEDTAVGHRHAETLDYLAREAMRECGERFPEAYRETLDDYHERVWESRSGNALE
ncbi:carboxypeptidase-like regulatory domain-containing protein [Alcanivorax sp. JB21]|uniref:carboxypeptidase-like regulatory domain-containing protein n=1 Tax=Alcanivorax limicola TaxID=2874102 RepID=UPI001CC0053A|nr:carboxypeptidase-like regulatory domain-containing protein [Alcanivorax limicola]MBZ2190068.1 carboxypeptidase-like regulatory domain-containing protein [Alcanivorax limicola]